MSEVQGTRSEEGLFIPRTVLAFERTAPRLARRLTAPVRTFGTRALRFADRLLAHTFGQFTAGDRPAVGKARRAGAMIFPAPWYEVDDETGIFAPATSQTAAA